MKCAFLFLLIFSSIFYSQDMISEALMDATQLGQGLETEIKRDDTTPRRDIYILVRVSLTENLLKSGINESYVKRTIINVFKNKDLQPRFRDTLTSLSRKNFVFLSIAVQTTDVAFSILTQFFRSIKYVSSADLDLHIANEWLSLIGVTWQDGQFGSYSLTNPNYIITSLEELLNNFCNAYIQQNYLE